MVEKIKIKLACKFVSKFQESCMIFQLYCSSNLILEKRKGSLVNQDLNGYQKECIQGIRNEH